MWGHLRALFFVDLNHVQAGNVFVKSIYFLTGFGHQAVMVFFVLSGFLISSATFNRYASGTWSWRHYAMDRSVRLYLVLIPGLILGWLWDRAGIFLFSATGLYSHPLVGFGSSIAEQGLTPGIFLGNLLFLQAILCTELGSNGPLWSLAYEFWYYVLFPLGLAAGLAWSSRSIRRALPFTLLAVVVGVFMGWNLLTGFLVWLAGSALVMVFTGFRISRPRALSLYRIVSSLLFAGCLFASRIRGPALLGGDLSVGFAFTLFLFAVLQSDSGMRQGPYARISHFFSGFSYSLYVLHFPMLLFARAWIGSPGRWQPDFKHLLYAAIAGAAVLIYAWIVSVFTEAKTPVVRSWIKGVAFPVN